MCFFYCYNYEYWSKYTNYSNKGEDFTELLRFAFSGVNVIPTVMLLMMLLYWVLAIIGLFDFDFFDVDLDIDAGDATGPLDALAVFINLGEVPVALAFSLIILNFWIIAMLTHYLPISVEGLLAGILLVPELILSMVITRMEIKPLKKVFKRDDSKNDIQEKILKRRCVLITDLSKGRLGQAKVNTNGAAYVINVKAEFEEENFLKNDIAFVFRKDAKDVYYIAKSLSKDEFFMKEMEEE
ncbi:MAG: DUF1449 family protein [Clostridia bacterium]|nr:DUF1449 family protein [Clostridia bacterium]